MFQSVLVYFYTRAAGVTFAHYTEPLSYRAPHDNLASEQPYLVDGPTWELVTQYIWEKEIKIDPLRIDTILSGPILTDVCR